LPEEVGRNNKRKVKIKIMKIGTVNFHLSQNYGALMVTYSLKAFLKKCGFNSLTVNYYPDYHKLMYPKPHASFQSFISEYLQPFGDESEHYDLLIYGSDAIWKSYKDYGFDDVYWGSNKLLADKKITFAASSVMSHFNDESDELFKKNLSNFYGIGVREDILRDYLLKYTSKAITHTCDPTFLLEREDYNPIASKKLIDGDYAVIYNRQLSRRIIEIAETVSIKTHLPVYILNGDGTLQNQHGNTVRNDIGPREFLSMIMYSSFVLAASFHAVAFSIIFGKPFYSIMKYGAERVESLLRMAKLENRLVNHSSEIDTDCVIDYKSVYDNLNNYVLHSKEYLRKFLV
jgi:hypothetical protein